MSRSSVRTSVRARLTLWHTAAVAVVLATFALGTYGFLVQSAARLVDRSLADDARAFVEVWVAERAEHDTSAHAAAADAADEFRSRDRRVLVYDRVGLLVAASDSDPLLPGLPAAALRTLHRSPFAATARAATPGAPAHATLGTDDTWVRMAAVHTAVGGEPFTIVLLASLRAQEEAREAYVEALLVAIPLALAAAALGGYVLARASLDPVARITTHAEQISATNLHERLTAPNPHDELGRLAGVLNGLLARLERAFEQQRQFMADASHELRTPVTVFRSAADIALSQPTRPEADYRETLTVVSGEGRRLTRLVDDLFLLARADSGEQPVRPESLDLGELLAGAAQAARALAAGRGVRVTYGATDEAPLVADGALLTRLVMNLLDNAIRHTPRGGTVRLSLTRERSAYRIDVQDSGPGVPAAARPHVFDRFYRADAARARGPGADHDGSTGAGLGLAIVRWVAEAHGGSVQLEESGTAGARFAVRLPAPPTGEPALGGPEARGL